MKTLALDPAAKCGFAHSDGHRGVWHISRPSDRHPGERLARLRQHLIDAHIAWGYERLAYEEATFGSHHISKIALHNRLAGVIELTAKQLGVELFPVTPSAIKKFATGNGRADKQQMIRAAESQLGIKTLSDDEADALWVLELSNRNIRPEPKAKSKKRKRVPKLF